MNKNNPLLTLFIFSSILLYLSGNYAFTQIGTEITAKILPLGNSVTQGAESHNTYRKNLYQKLVNAGYDVDFVGSMNQTKDCTGYPDNNFDWDHEGHWGWRTDEIINGLDKGCYGSGKLADWLQAYDADIALIHLGTNDVLDDQSTSSTLSELEQIIDILRNDSPDITIFLAKLIPMNRQKNAGIIDLNSQIQSVVDNKSTSQSHVIPVDQYSGFDKKNDTYDGIHPAPSGEEKMAQKWFNAIDEFLKSGDTNLFLTTSTNSLSFGSSAGSQDITISSNVGWDISTTESGWISYSPANGSNDETITISVTENTGSQRSGSVIISALSQDVNDVEIIITQNAMGLSDVTIIKTSTTPLIDGLPEDFWNALQSKTISNIDGGLGSDLSATWKSAWDETHLFFFVAIEDDVLNNDFNSQAHKDDGAEIYIDADNSKESSYDEINDFQLLFNWNDNTVHLGGNSATNTNNIQFATAEASAGYNVEISLPWNTLGVTPAINNLIGLDIHVNDDDDGSGRDNKIAWYATTDDLWQRPDKFGTAKLGASLTKADYLSKKKQPIVFPNPFHNEFFVKNAHQFTSLKLTSSLGKEVFSSKIINTKRALINNVNHLPQGIYLLHLMNSSGHKTIKKIIKY